MDTITIKKRCLKRMLKEEFINDPSYELFSKILNLSDEDALGCIERQVKILRDSFSSIEVDQAVVNNTIVLIANPLSRCRKTITENLHLSFNKT